MSTGQDSSRRHHVGDEGSASEDSVPEASASVRPVISSVLDKSKPKKKKKRSEVTSGIIYISRVPPGMTPQKVRHLMARWGEVGKVYAQRSDGGLISA